MVFFIVKEILLCMAFSEVNPMDCNQPTQPGGVCHNVYGNGDWKDAFTDLPGFNKLNLSTNPAPVPVYTFKSLGGYSDPNMGDPEPFENRKIYLNGLSIEILDNNYHGSGDVVVQIKWDHFQVENDVRWCGDIVLNSNPFNSTNPSLNLLSNKKILLDRGKSPTQYKSVSIDPSTGQHLLSQPTVFTAETAAYIKTESNSTIEVDNGSTMVMKAGSILELGVNSKIHVKNGSKLIFEPGSQIVVLDGGTIIIDQGCEIISGDNLLELSQNSYIQIDGSLVIHPNSTFSFSGDGHLKFNRNGSHSIPNVVGGQGTKFEVNGSGKADKKIEILKNVVFQDYTEVSFKNAGFHFEENTEMYINAKFKVDNLRVTSLSGVFNNHKGIMFIVNENSLINNSQFQYGNFGLRLHHLYATLTTEIKNSSFMFNNTGLTTFFGGVEIIGCNLSQNNNNGYNANVKTMPSFIHTSSFNSNINGINYNAGANSNLHIEKSTMHANANSGILYGGNSILSMGCTNITMSGTGSTGSGIHLQNSAGLNLSPFFTPVSGYNTIHSNNRSVVGAYGGMLYLDEGRNDFLPATGFYSFAGTFIDQRMIGNRNRWNSSGTAPVLNVDYETYIFNQSFQQHNFTDNNPLTYNVGIESCTYEPGTASNGYCRK